MGIHGAAPAPALAGLGAPVHRAELTLVCSGPPQGHCLCQLVPGQVLPKPLSTSRVGEILPRTGGKSGASVPSNHPL